MQEFNYLELYLENPKFAKDKEVTLLTTSHCGVVLKYASPKLRDDRI